MFATFAITDYVVGILVLIVILTFALVQWAPRKAAPPPDDSGTAGPA